MPRKANKTNGVGKVGHISCMKSIYTALDVAGRGADRGGRGDIICVLPPLYKEKKLISK